MNRILQLYTHTELVPFLTRRDILIAIKQLLRTGELNLIKVDDTIVNRSRRYHHLTSGSFILPTLIKISDLFELFCHLVNGIERRDILLSHKGASLVGWQSLLLYAFVC